MGSVTWLVLLFLGVATMHRQHRSSRYTNLTVPHVPRYMLELFNRVQETNSPPPGEVVRSFQVAGHWKNSRRSYLLMFQVSVPETERVDRAELRVYVQTVPTDGAAISVLLITGNTEMILSRTHVHYGWATLDISHAVRRWCIRRHQTQLLRLEVSGHQVRLYLTPGGYFEPLLLTYSTPMNHVNYQRRSKRSVDIISNDYDDEETNVVQTSRKKKVRSICRRKPMYVDFAEINYDTWIIAPPGYEAFECTGKCFYPMGDHLSPTKHAIVRTLLHTVAPKKASRACCVPTRLEPISILYLGEDGVVTYKYHYEDMVVAECGCR